jgi:hypothetical protein
VKKSLARTLWAVAGSGLLAGAMAGLTAAPASASVVGTSAAAARAVTPANSSAKLYACYYDIGSSPVRVWRYPGGGSRKGNTAVATTVSHPFNSIPYISSGKVYGQHWVYGELGVYPPGDGAFGWVGRNYLSQIRCLTNTFQVSNGAVETTHPDDPFSSEPSEVSASFRGQTWVWGVDPFVSNTPGWIGRNYLKLSSCNSSGCFYDVKGSGIREWMEPGGAAGA